MNNRANKKKSKILRDVCTESIGFIELILGLVRFFFVISFDLLSIIEKPPGVFIFVVISAVVSTAIGYGILHYKNWARVLLIFFSGYVIALKALIYLDVVQLTGDIIAVPPPYIKDIISILYHLFVVIFFANKKVALKFKA